MRLYHYSTWAGAHIEKHRLLKPNRRYANWVKQTILTEWPLLTFLTVNPEWEPSIQSLSRENYWEKCCSHPETYAALGIPCWKFEINPNPLVLGCVTNFKISDHWQEMLDDARKMGSVVEDWRITVQDAPIIKAWEWENDQWCIRKTG